MSPRLALLLCFVLILGALIVDRTRKPPVSNTLWIPWLWLFILASRPVEFWFNPIQQLRVISGAEESSLDRNLLIVLMTLGMIVLLRRKHEWRQWVKANGWVIAFMLYCGVSTLWADFPDIAIKRWMRALGALMMMTILLSEANPVEAVRVAVRRCSYILVPLSLVLIKYFPSIGVTYNEWTGGEQLIGVTTNKNALGRLCLICGVFLLWDVVTLYKQEPAKTFALKRLVAVGMLALTMVLLYQSHSSTSLAAFILGTFIFMALGLKSVQSNANMLGTLVIVSSVVLIVVDQVFGLLETAVGALGRDLTFTDRTFIWQDLLALHTNPIFGVGYDSFWLGERLLWFIRTHLVGEAHNGYIEAYLETGTIGLVLLFGLLWSVFMKAKQCLLRPAMSDYGRLRLAVLAIFLIYNITEASYKVTHVMAFTLFLLAIDWPTIATTSLGGAVKGEPASKTPPRATARNPYRRPEPRVQHWARKKSAIK